MDELARTPLIIVKQAPGRANRTTVLLKHLQNRGISPNIVIQCESFMAVQTAVKTGAGLGILYRDITEPDVPDPDLKVVTIPELKIEFDSFIIYHKERPLSPSAQEFLALLRQWPQEVRWIKPFSSHAWLLPIVLLSNVYSLSARRLVEAAMESL